MGEVVSNHMKEEDVVIGTNDMNLIRAAQENHGGWNSDMNECMTGPCRILMKTASHAFVRAPSGRIFLINLQLLKPFETDQFQKGDIVKISDDINLTQRLQLFHGSYLPVMALLTGETGKVDNILPTGDIIVKVNGIKLAYNPQLLKKIGSRNIATNKASTTQKKKFSSGDIVRILKDKHKVKQLQSDHGGWNESMSLFLGMKCIIMSLDLDGDLRVLVMGNILTLNPDCVEKIDINVDSEFDPTQLSTSMFAKFLEVMSDVNIESDNSVRVNQNFELFLAIHGGDLKKVCQLMDTIGPEVSFNSLTPLVVAVVEGHTDIVKYLLEKKVKINAMDKDGDTALHFAVQKNELNICKTLVENGADINLQNNKKITPIMISVHAGFQDILKMFVSRKDANVNIGDSDGDTALHLAILKSRAEIVEILLDHGADMKVFNKKKFTPFHLTVFLGNVKILEILLKKCNGSVVDLQNDDKLAAIHIAAMNNHLGCLKLLIQYKANINIQNMILQTALHLAVSQKYFDTVKILVENKAELNMKDINGDTPLHDSITMHRDSNSRKLPKLFGFEIIMGIQTGSDKLEDIAVYLVENGAKLDIQNSSGMTPIELCSDESMKRKLLLIKHEYDKTKRQNVATSDQTSHRSNDKEMEKLCRKIKQMSEEKQCVICKVRCINTVFNCGHSSCNVCASNLDECYICGCSIQQKILMK